MRRRELSVSLTESICLLQLLGGIEAIFTCACLHSGAPDWPRCLLEQLHVQCGIFGAQVCTALCYMFIFPTGKTVPYARTRELLMVPLHYVSLHGRLADSGE